MALFPHKSCLGVSAIITERNTETKLANEGAQGMPFLREGTAPHRFSGQGSRGMVVSENLVSVGVVFLCAIVPNDV
jgi:hypothetical protein